MSKNHWKTERGQLAPLKLCSIIDFNKVDSDNWQSQLRLTVEIDSDSEKLTIDH